MLSSHLSPLQCSILYPGENHVQDSDKDPRQDPIGSQRIVNMMLYNLAQDPGKSWTRLLSLSPPPPTLPSPVTRKNLQEGTGL